MQCPHCNKNNPADAHFCRQCGTSLDLKRCPQCGHENPLPFNFCEQCGAGISGKPCPQCRHINNESFSFCEQCGYSFETPTAEPLPSPRPTPAPAPAYVEVVQPQPPPVQAPAHHLPAQVPATSTAPRRKPGFLGLVARFVVSTVFGYGLGLLVYYLFRLAAAFFQFR